MSADAEQTYLSPTFQSSALHSPWDVKRATVSDPNYSRYMSAGPEGRRKLPADRTEEGRPRTAGHQWGRHYSYGGIGSNVPHEFTQFDPYGRPFGIRGHDHWTTGASVLPRDVAGGDSYDLTDLKRSNLRPNDELVPRPLSINIGKNQVPQRFPADHPFTSHTPQREVFPSVEPPKTGVLDEETGLPSRKHIGPIPPLTAQTTVRHKTRGASARHEKLILFDEDERIKANQDRPRQHDIWDVDRSQRHKRALTYPAPQVLYSARPEQRSDMTVRPRTANTLGNMQDRSFSTTTYQGQHTGRGPKHVHNLDDYEEKQTEKELADTFPEDRTAVSWDAQTWKPGQKMMDPGVNRTSSLKPASAVSRNSAVPPAKFGGDGYTTGYHTAKPREGRNSRSAAINLKVEDSAMADEYGEMTADGRMRPGTAARCSSAGGGVRGQRQMGGSRPNTPWVKRPGTGRYRGGSSDEDAVDANTGGDGEESEEEESDEDAGTAGNTRYNSGATANQPDAPVSSRQKSACRHDASNYADDWRPGTGVPRPKSTYHERQAGFNKSSVIEQLNLDFPERHPDVRDNQHYAGGKRHTIHGTHSYWYHHG